MDTNKKDFATANEVPLHSACNNFEDDDRSSSVRDNRKKAVLRLRGRGIEDRSIDSAAFKTSSNIPKGNGEFESSCKNEMYDERLRGVRSFFRKHLENTSMTSEDIGKIICEEAKNFVEGRPIGSELDRLEGLEDDFHHSSNKTYRVDGQLQQTYYNNADNFRILGCLRRLQEFEDAVDCDSSQVTAIGACASTEIDGYGHRMSLQIGKKKKGKAIAAEDMLKTCLIGIERYETLIEKYDEKMHSLKVRFQDVQNSSGEEICKLQQQLKSMASAKNKVAKDKDLIEKNYKEIFREKERIIKDLENQRRLEIIEAQNQKKQFMKEKIDSTKNLNKVKHNLAKINEEMEKSQNAVKSLEVKYAEVSSKNDCLREEIGELQVREMKERERSKKYRERIAQLTKAKVECLLKIENFKSTWAKVAEQDWKIKEIDEYMKDKDEEVSKLETEIEGMKMHEKAASIKSKNIVDRLNRRLRDKAEQNKKLKANIKDLKIELLAETSDRKHDRWSGGFQNIESQTDMTCAEITPSIRVDEPSYGYNCTACSLHPKDLEEKEIELLKLKAENHILTKKIPQLEAINKSCLSLAERALEKSERDTEEKMKMKQTFASLTRETNGDFEIGSTDRREGARLTLCTAVSQTAAVSRDLNDFGTLVREKVYQEKMEMRRFVDDMDMYKKRQELERMQKAQMEAEKLFIAEREKAEKSFRAERDNAEKSYKAERKNFLHTENKLRKVEADLESVQNQLSATAAMYNALKKSKNRAKKRIKELERLQIEQFTKASRNTVSKVAHISTQTEMSPPVFPEALAETERGRQPRRQLRFSNQPTRYGDAYEKKVERYPSRDEFVNEEEIVQQQNRAKQTFYRLNLLNTADTEISLGEYERESSKKKRSFFKWIREKMASKRKRRKYNKMLERSRIAISDDESAKRPSSKGSFFFGRFKKKKSSERSSKKSKKKKARTVEKETNDANENVHNLPMVGDETLCRSTNPTNPAACGLVNTHEPTNDVSGQAPKIETPNRDVENQVREDAEISHEFTGHISRAPLVVREATETFIQEQKAQGSIRQESIAFGNDTVHCHRGQDAVNKESYQGKDAREPNSVLQQPPTFRNDVANSRTFCQKTSGSGPDTTEVHKDTSTSQQSSALDRNAAIHQQNLGSVCHPPIIVVKEMESCNQVDVQNESQLVQTNVVHVKSSQAWVSNENLIEIKLEGMTLEVEQPDVKENNRVTSGSSEAINENRTVSKEAGDCKNDTKETDNDGGNKIESGGDEGNSDNSGDDDKANDAGGAQNGKKKKGRLSVIWKGFRSKKGKKTSTDNEANVENGNNEKKDKKYEKKLKKRLKKEKKKQKNAEKKNKKKEKEKKKKKEKEKKKKKDSKIKDEGKEDKPADGLKVSKDKNKDSKKQKSNKKSKKETSPKKGKKAEGKKDKEAKSEIKKKISEKKKVASEKKKAAKLKERKAKIMKEWLRLEKKKAKLDKVKTRSSKEKEDLRRKKRIVYLKKAQLENKWSKVERDEKEMIQASKQEKEAAQNEPGTSGTDGRLLEDKVDVQNLAEAIEPVDTGDEPSSTTNSPSSAAGHKKRKRISINFKKFFSGKKRKNDVKHESDSNQSNQAGVETAPAKDGGENEGKTAPTKDGEKNEGETAPAKDWKKIEGETAPTKDGGKSGEINQTSFRNYVVEPEEDFDVLPQIIIHQSEVHVDNHVQDSVNTIGSAKEIGSGERSENEDSDDNIQLIESTYESNKALAKSNSNTSVESADQVRPFHGWDSSSNDSRGSLTIIKKVKSLPKPYEDSPRDALQCKNKISALITPGDSVKIHEKGEAIEIDTGEEEYDRAKAAAKVVCQASNDIINLLPVGRSTHSEDQQRDAAKKQEVELKNRFNDSWSDEESVMDRVLQEDVKKELPSMNMTQNKSWQQQNKDGRLMDDILDVKTTTSPKKSAAKRQDDELEISSFDSRSDEEKIMDELLQEELEDDQLLKNMTKNKSWQLRTDEVVSVDTTTSSKKNAAKRQELDLKKEMYESWSDEERMMDQILQGDAKKDQLSKNLTQNKRWQQQDEDERLMDEILGVDAMKSPEKSKKSKRVSFGDSTAEVVVGGIEGSKQPEAMKTNTHRTKVFSHFDKNNEKKAAFPEKVEKHHVVAVKSSLKTNFTKQEKGQTADSKDGVKWKGKKNENHLASSKNYNVKPKVKFDLQPQITIRKSEEEIVFEQDVDNLLAEQEVEQEDPMPLISKAKTEQDPFSRTALMGKGHFIYRGKRKEQEILREIKQVDIIKKEDKKLKREAKMAAAKTFASVARPAEHSFVISPAEHTIRVSPAFEHYGALPAISRQPK